MTTEPAPVEPDNPAAYALARHIADHPVSTIQAAFRYLNAPLGIELHEPAAGPPACNCEAEVHMGVGFCHHPWCATRAVPAGRDALRDRIAEAQHGQLPGCTHDEHGADCGSLADAVVAVLPPPADRAAVLLEVADFMRGLRVTGTRATVQDIEKELREQAAAARRMADEAQQQKDADVVEAHDLALSFSLAPVPSRAAVEEPATETEAHPPTHTWKVESPRRDQWASWGATHDERVWAVASYEDSIEHASGRPFRLVRATTTYTVEAEHTPAASQPDEPQEAAPAVPQCDGCGHLVHRARKCTAVRYGERCECDEPLATDGEA